MKKIIFTNILIIISLVSCSTSNQKYIKYDSLNFVYTNIRGDELNSFENKFYFLLNGQYLAYNVNISTLDKINLLNKLEEINFFDIADSINYNENYKSRYSKLFIRHFSYEKEIKWNSKSLENSKYENEIKELSVLIREIMKDNLKDLEFPKRGAIW